MVGRVCLSPEIALTDVFYVPNITCNLISIRQLISAINCQITFANALCVIQDRTSKMLIGEGELSRGDLLLQAYLVIFGDEDTGRSVFDLAQRAWEIRIVNIFLSFRTLVNQIPRINLFVTHVTVPNRLVLFFH